LKKIENLSLDNSLKLLEKINSQWSHIYIAVLEDNTIIGTLTLLIERKILWWWSKAGHIEDVAVRVGYEWMWIWKALNIKAVEESQNLGCYKIILDCEESLEKFYNKVWFETSGIFMRKYY
jgi:glucosamine-phosphate N-acetyltransferase